MTKEIRELQDWLEKHPTDFLANVRLKRLIKAYGIELDAQQELELKGAFR